MTLTGVIKCLPELIDLVHITSPSEQRKKILQCQSCIIYAISEIIRNILNGNIQISNSDKLYLSKYKDKLRQISKSKVSLRDRRRLINQVGGALPALLIPAITILSSLLANKV